MHVKLPHLINCRQDFFVPDAIALVVFFIDSLPRPLIACGVVALFWIARVYPIWFATRMQELALVAETLWCLVGAEI